MKVERVLITGAAGYLARFVIERLRPHYALTLTDLNRPQAPHDDLPFIQADISFYPEFEGVCANQDAVVHLVALVRERFGRPHSLFADVMVKGTWNIAEACIGHRVRRLVNISSIVACGWPADVQQAYRVGSPSGFRPSDLYYCLSKSLGEQIGLAYHQAHGLSVIHLRPGVIAGDGLNPDPQTPQGRRGPWFVYVDPRDVAQAVEGALQTDVPYGCYQIVAGRRDALFDWSAASRDLGYQPQHNWPEIPESEC